MNMFQKTHYLILLCLWGMVFLPSCQSETLEEEPKSTPMVALGEQGLCPKGYTYSWPLDYTTNPNGNYSPDYTFKIETGLYFTGDCLCKVGGFNLEFQADLSTYEFELVDANGEDIPYSLASNLPGGISQNFISIPNPGDLPDPVITVILDFVGNPPTLVTAGGLCITENYGGGFPSNPQTNPIKEQVPNPPNGYTTNLWIPTAIATPL